MGGASCEKPKKKKHRKGLWSPDEDQRLRDYVLTHGHACWTSVPINAGLQRNGKSCRLRWINYLRPGLKRGAFSIVEEETILTLHKILGNKWSQIAHHLPGRTDNEVKNYWHSYLKKRVAKTENRCRQGQIQSSTSSTHTPYPTPTPTPSLQSHQTELSLPKVLFADWLSFDHQDSCKNIIDTHTHASNLGDTSIDHDMLPSPFNIPLHYYSPQDFTIYHDVYIPESIYSNNFPRATLPSILSSRYIE